MTKTEPASQAEGSSQQEVIFRGRLITVGRMPGGWESVVKAPAVCVLAIRDGQVLGVEQPRPVIGRTTWELPAGIIDPNETALQAARRELAEETQLSGELELLTEFWSSPGFTDEHTSLFLATELRPTAGVPDEHEEITVRWRELAELEEAVRSGSLVSSASTAVGLAWAFRINQGR